MNKNLFEAPTEQKERYTATQTPENVDQITPQKGSTVVKKNVELLRTPQTWNDEDPNHFSTVKNNIPATVTKQITDKNTMKKAGATGHTRQSTAQKEEHNKILDS